MAYNIGGVFQSSQGPLGTWDDIQGALRHAANPSVEQRQVLSLVAALGEPAFGARDASARGVQPYDALIFYERQGKSFALREALFGNGEPADPAEFLHLGYAHLAGPVFYANGHVRIAPVTPALLGACKTTDGSKELLQRVILVAPLVQPRIAVDSLPVCAQSTIDTILEQFEPLARNLQ